MRFNLKNKLTFTELLNGKVSLSHLDVSDPENPRRSFETYRPSRDCMRQLWHEDKLQEDTYT